MSPPLTLAFLVQEDIIQTSKGDNQQYYSTITTYEPHE